MSYVAAKHEIGHLIAAALTFYADDQLQAHLDDVRLRIEITEGEAIGGRFTFDGDHLTDRDKAMLQSGCALGGAIALCSQMELSLWLSGRLSLSQLPSISPEDIRTFDNACSFLAQADGDVESGNAISRVIFATFVVANSGWIERRFGDLTTLGSVTTTAFALFADQPKFLSQVFNIGDDMLGAVNAAIVASTKEQEAPANA